MKRLFLIISIIIILVAGFLLSEKFFGSRTANITPLAQCQVKEMVFYYLDQCSWCQKVKNEGTIDRLEQLGVKVKEINVAIGPTQHQFRGVPTFVINNKVYEGYRTFEELKNLLACPKETEQASVGQIQDQNLFQDEFRGEKGEKVILENGEIRLPASIFDDNQARFYNTLMPSGKTIYFFVVKDKQGIYRAAANACQVCFSVQTGFRQEGDEIVCNNCGNRYPIEKIATEKGGCNPGPINSNLEARDGQIIIKQADLKQVEEFFN